MREEDNPQGTQGELTDSPDLRIGQAHRLLNVKASLGGPSLGHQAQTAFLQQEPLVQMVFLSPTGFGVGHESYKLNSMSNTDQL